MAWRCAILCLLCLPLAGCSVLQPTPFLPTPVRPPEIDSTAGALQAALAGQYPLDALTIRYDVGNRAWDGHTRLVVHGRGRAEVTFEDPAGVQSWQAPLGEERVLALVRLLVEHALWDIRGQRQPGVPDEARPTVTVEAEGFEPLEVGMWQGEAEAHPDMKPIVDALAGLALQVSGGVAR